VGRDDPFFPSVRFTPRGVPAMGPCARAVLRKPQSRVLPLSNHLPATPFRTR